MYNFKTVPRGIEGKKTPLKAVEISGKPPGNNHIDCSKRINRKKIVIKVIPCLLCIGLTALPGSTIDTRNITQDNWNDYCGWHYGNTPAWGGWVREFVQYSLGFSLITDVGGSQTVDTQKLGDVYSTLAELSSDIDMLQLDGGLGQVRDTLKAKRFVEMIEADSAVLWKSVVYRQCNELAQLPDSRNRLYYQLGNEITSTALSSAIRYAQGMPYSSGSDYDTSLIPFLVENYMAPTIAAIDSSSVHSFGAEGKINICLGSITNAGGKAALPYTEALLNYTISGTYAPSLAGKKVYELINIITIHYMMGNSSPEVWPDKMQDYLDWIGKGRITGVWSTEEVGIKKAMSGAGAAYAARATFRYLKAAIDNGYSSKVVRTNYWGWENGPANTRVNDFLSELHGFLGSVKLRFIDSIHTIPADPSGLEWYGFVNESNDKGILAMSGNYASVDRVALDMNGWGTIADARLIRFDTTGTAEIPVTVTPSGDSLVLTFSSQEISISDVLLFEIDGSLLKISANKTVKTEKPVIYSNPATGTVYIREGDENIESIQLLDLQGNLVEEYTANKVSVAHLTAGTYLLVARFRDNVPLLYKFIRQ